MRPSIINIEPYRREHLDEAARLWHATYRQAFPYLKRQPTLEQLRRCLDEIVCVETDVRLAFDAARLVGFLSLEDSYLHHLYVGVADYRCGVGSALLLKAKELSPGGLTLHTLERNQVARSFYEKQGFEAVGCRPNAYLEEMEMEYCWRSPVQAVRERHSRPHANMRGGFGSCP